jgi:hypothetical protein
VIDTLATSAEILSAAGFSTFLAQSPRRVLLFEDSTTIGFAFSYLTSTDLVNAWAPESERVIAEYQLALRRAGPKAWNTYCVLLANEAEEERRAALAAIEENLTGTRKIARAGMRDTLDVREALLPLLPMQNAPRLEAVDIEAEISQRASSLHPRVLSAFLSKADDAVTIQVLEEQS